MKNFKFQDSQNQKKLFLIFENYFSNENDLDNILYFDKKCISIYDHWLTEEEEFKYITRSVFLDKLESNNFKPTEIKKKFNNYYEAEKKSMSFYFYIFSNFKVYGCNKNKKFYEFLNIQSFFHACEQSIREEKFLDLFIPSIQCIILGNFDFTNVLLYREKKDLLNISVFVKKSGLFLI